MDIVVSPNAGSHRTLLEGTSEADRNSAVQSKHSGLAGAGGESGLAGMKGFPALPNLGMQSVFIPESAESAPAFSDLAGSVLSVAASSGFQPPADLAGSASSNSVYSGSVPSSVLASSGSANSVGLGNASTTVMMGHTSSSSR